MHRWLSVYLLLNLPLLAGAQPAQRSLGLRAGAITFRDNDLSAFRYAMPALGVQYTTTRQRDRYERTWLVNVDLCQQQNTQRLVQQAFSTSIMYRRTHKLGTANWRVGWQAQWLTRGYGNVNTLGESNQVLGGMASLELAPVVAYGQAVRWLGRPGRVSNYLSVPLLSYVLGGGYQLDGPVQGVVWPGNYPALANQLDWTIDTAVRHPWRVSYQWLYRHNSLPFADQYFANNSLVISYVL